MIEKVNEAGVFAAVGMTIVGTTGHLMTSWKCDMQLDMIWLACFLIAILTLSGAVVNFDPKRLIK